MKLGEVEKCVNFYFMKFVYALNHVKSLKNEEKFSHGILPKKKN